MKPAVFLDRDGVLIEEVNYLADPEQVRLVPGAAEAVARLNRLHVPVVVVTNQAGVARGLFAEEQVGRVHEHLARLLERRGARVDAYYHCPHHPEAAVERYRAECECRKPRAGMLRRAARDLGIDLAHSFLVGDKVSDLEAGAAAGCRTVLVRTGHGRTIPLTEIRRPGLNLLGVSPDLTDAVTMCLIAGLVPVPLRPARVAA